MRPAHPGRRRARRRGRRPPTARAAAPPRTWASSASRSTSGLEAELPTPAGRRLGRPRAARLGAGARLVRLGLPQGRHADGRRHRRPGAGRRRCGRTTATFVTSLGLDLADALHRRRPPHPGARARLAARARPACSSPATPAGLLEPWTREGISFALRSGRARRCAPRPPIPAAYPAAVAARARAGDGRRTPGAARPSPAPARRPRGAALAAGHLGAVHAAGQRRHVAARAGAAPFRPRARSACWGADAACDGAAAPPGRASRATPRASAGRTTRPAAAARMPGPRTPCPCAGDHDGRPEQRGHRVHLAPQHDRHDAGQDVAQHPAADAGQAAERGGGDRAEPRVEGLGRAGRDEQPEPGGVEQPHRAREPLDERAEEEDDGARRPAAPPGSGCRAGRPAAGRPAARRGPPRRRAPRRRRGTARRSASSRRETASVAPDNPNTKIPEQVQDQQGRRGAHRATGRPQVAVRSRSGVDTLAILPSTGTPARDVVLFSS